MNLRNNQITVKELMANPAAKVLFQKQFPLALSNPMVRAAQSLTLAQAIELARQYVPQSTIDGFIRDLKRI